MDRYIRKLLFLLFCLASYSINHSQAIINYSNPTDAVAFLTSGSLTPLNPNFIGGAQQLGVVDASNTNLGIDHGIILATGDCQMSSNSPGNSDDSSSDGFLLSGSDPDLEIISNTTVFDAAVLEFDFVATSTNANIQFIFASEEYNEYVCGAVNDAFGIFISGPGYNGPFSNGAENIANIPGTDTPVSINTVNNGTVGIAGNIDDCMNSYPDWNSYSDLFVDNSALNPNPAIIEYDGFTIPITIDIPLQCGESYHIKIAIGDGGDPVYDSAVFLIAEGFSDASANLITVDSLNLCYGNQVQLNSQVIGNANWSPTLGLDDPQSATPMATPSSDTWYYVSTNACGSLISDSVFVDVGDIIEIVNFVSICEGEVYQEGNSVYNSFGMYEDVYVSAGGCDSVVTTMLSVSPIVETTNVVTICPGETYIEGASIYNQAGFYQDNYQNQNGCDSIVTTILSVYDIAASTMEVSICSGESYQLGGNNYNQSGNYAVSFQSINGCDSIVNLNLSIMPENALNVSAQICEGESFQFGNQSYSQSGSYSQNYTSSLGCDSTVYISLFVNPILESTNEVEICNGSAHYEGSSVYTEAGTYQDYYLSSYGCDSVVTTILQLSDYLSSTNYISICEGDFHQEGSSIYSTPGSYEDWYSTQNCDSLVITILTVEPLTNSTAEVNICEGESHIVGSSIYGNSGIYSDLLLNQNGCDSTVVTHLNVNNNYEIFNDLSICEGESHFVGSNIYSQSGTYQDILTSSAGCDSIINTNLIVIPGTTTDAHFILCEGDSLEYANEYYHVAGNYQMSFLNTFDCDSIVEFSIEIVPNSLTSYEIDLCPSDNFVLDLSNYSNHEVVGMPNLNSGIYTFEESGTYPYSVFNNSCTTNSFVEINHLESYSSSTHEIEICEGKEVMLEATYPELNYWWENGSSDSIMLASGTGMYRLYYQYECGDFYEDFQLVQKECNCDLFIPNSFSPDADGINETWAPSSNCELATYELSVYDRWGELIFSTDNIDFAFVGGSNDYYYKSDIYVYRLKYKFKTDIRDRVSTGHITLLR